ncbi:MAG: cupin domain-containing protein [Cyanobacteria bacterium J06554_6]
MKAKPPRLTLASSVNAWPDTKPLVLTDLFSLAENPERLAWQPFCPGVEIYRLYERTESGSEAALLKYAPGASVPVHRHGGYEHILVLSGSQSDHRGTYAAGSLVVNAPETSHAVTSENGCIVLIVWEKPVVLKEENC